MIHPTKKSGFPGNSRKTRLFYCTYQLPQLADQLEFVRISAAQYLPPRGRGTAKRWMRNGDTFPFLTQSSQRVQPFPMYLFNEMHTDSEHIAVPHPPPCGGTFPPGDGIAFRHPHRSQFLNHSRNPLRPFYPTTIKSLGNLFSTSQPSSVTMTRSSIRTPNSPGR